MQQHWRTFVKRAGIAAYAPVEVKEALAIALRKDLERTPLQRIRDMLGFQPQDSLFSNDASLLVPQLEALKRECHGSYAGEILLDCVIDEVNTGGPNHNVFAHGLANAVEEIASRQMRAIKEHATRKASPELANSISERMADARASCDFGMLANELQSPTRTSSKANISSPTDIDSGPAL